MQPYSNEMIRQAERRITKARTALLLNKKFVFWATCALHLKPVAYSHMALVECGPIGVDGTHLFYDPDYILHGGWTDEQMLGVMAHEVSHCTKGDVWRRGSRDPNRWNIAADMRINAELLAAGLKLPAGSLQCPREFVGLSAEEIYNKLPLDAGKNCGRNYGNCGEVLDAPGSEKGSASDRAAAQEAMRRHWEIISRQAAEIAKAQGHLPAGYEHLIEPVRPRLDPAALLRHFVSTTRRNDYSWARGNRRRLYEGVYLPSLYSEGVGPLLIAADVSGSTQAVWSQFAGLLNAVLQDVQPDHVWFVECDAAVQHVTEFGPGDQLPERISIHGGGGTNMRPIWEWAAEQAIQPVCAIVLSDLEIDTHSFGEQQPFPVLWVTSRPGAVAPFGETVELN